MSAFVGATQSQRRARLNCRTQRLSTSSPISGNLALTTATRAAKTLLNCGEAIWAFITERASSPRPRTRFSEKSSGRTAVRLEALTLFTMPLIDFFSASHASLWYSSVDLSYHKKKKALHDCYMHTCAKKRGMDCGGSAGTLQLNNLNKQPHLSNISVCASPASSA